MRNLINIPNIPFLFRYESRYTINVGEKIMIIVKNRIQLEKKQINFKLEGRISLFEISRSCEKNNLKCMSKRTYKNTKEEIQKLIEITSCSLCK